MNIGPAQTWVSVAAADGLQGEMRVPGDKSVSHRAIMLASIAEGRSEISGFLEGEDTLATAAAFAAMGVRIDKPSEHTRHVYGVGRHGLSAPRAALDCGNAGTAMRLLSGLLVGQQFDSELCGDASLSRRPMRRVLEPLTAMGARIEAETGGLPPLRIRGGQPLHGIRYALPLASAQVKSALLLAGLYAVGDTEVIEPHPTRDYTERMLGAFAWPVAVNGNSVRVSGQARLRATAIAVPADFSSAAFFLVAASVVPGSDLVLREVGMNPRRTGLLRVLLAMGADIATLAEYERGGESVADLRVRHAALSGIDVPEAWVPDMIDEFPILFVAAALAHGRSVVHGAEELRVKESDRIAVMAKGLRVLGVQVAETPDGAVIEGRPLLQGGTVESASDHRCAMAFAVAGLCASEPVTIVDCANVATSFPGFVETANRVGFGLRLMSEDARCPQVRY